MPDQKSMISICETNPVLALLKQKSRHYPLEIIHRLFRDDYAIEAPIEAFLRVCSAVQGDLQLREGGGAYITPPVKMLEQWCDGSRDAAPWFAMTEGTSRGKMVSLRPAARQAYEMALSLDEDADAMSGEDARAFFESIASAAAHLRQDKTTTVERLKAEIEERNREIEKIQTVGMDEVSEGDKEAYAIELSRFISDLLNTMGKVPGRLRENVSQAREAFYELEGSHGEILRSVMEMMTAERKSRGYTMLETLNGIHYDARNRLLFEGALRVILEECKDYLSERTRRDARALFRSLSDISLRILSEDHNAVVQLSNFVESEAFERRRGQSRLLMELSETLRANSHHMRLRLRGPQDTPGFNMGVERHEEVKIHWFDLGLAEAPPAPLVTEEADLTAVHLDPAVAREMTKQATEKSAYLAPERITKWVEKIVQKNGATPLSRIIEFRPLKYGLDEIAAFTDVAMSKLPAEFREGWGMEIILHASVTPEAGEDLPCTPGSAVVIQCPDPVFLPEGQPGLVLGAPFKVNRNQASQEIVQRELTNAVTQGRENTVRVLRA